jgi:hypothetical protein
MKLKYWVSTAVLYIALGFCFERPAHAYADPGTGLLAYQSLGAIITGTIFHFRQRIERVLKKRSDKQSEGDKKSLRNKLNDQNPVIAGDNDRQAV